MAAHIFQEWLQQDFLPQMLFENFAVHPHRRGMAMASVTGSMNRIWPKWFRITFKTRCSGGTASNAFFFSCGAHSESFWPSHEKTCYPTATNEEAAQRGMSTEPQTGQSPAIQVFSAWAPDMWVEKLLQWSASACGHGKNPSKSFPSGSSLLLLLLSRVWVFATPWTATHQTSLSLTISRSLFKFMSVELVMMMSIESSQCQIH